MGAKGVQWSNGSKIKNVFALEGFPNLYRRVCLGGHGWPETKMGPSGITGELLGLFVLTIFAISRKKNNEKYLCSG